MLKLTYKILLKKKKLVTAWTYRVLHHDYRTTNRVEGAHEKLKKYFSCMLGGNTRYVGGGIN